MFVLMVCICLSKPTSCLEIAHFCGAQAKHDRRVHDGHQVFRPPVQYYVVPHPLLRYFERPVFQVLLDFSRPLQLTVSGKAEEAVNQRFLFP